MPSSRCPIAGSRRRLARRLRPRPDGLHVDDACREGAGFETQRHRSQLGNGAGPRRSGVGLGRGRSTRACRREPIAGQPTTSKTTCQSTAGGPRSLPPAVGGPACAAAARRGTRAGSRAGPRRPAVMPTTRSGGSVRLRPPILGLSGRSGLRAGALPVADRGRPTAGHLAPRLAGAASGPTPGSRHRLEHLAEAVGRRSR